MKQTDINRKELLAVNHNILKGLHDLYRYDYNKAYAIYKHAGKFTAKSLVKNGYIPEDNYKYQIVILIKRPHVRPSNELYHVKVTSHLDFETDIRGNYSKGLDKYYRKLDFNDDRKCDATTIYVVIQKTEDLTPRKELEDRIATRAHIEFVPTETDNYKFKVFRNWGDGDHNRTWDFRWYSKEQLADEIDKSGYYIQPVRRARSARAEIDFESLAEFLEENRHQFDYDSDLMACFEDEDEDEDE